MGRPSSNGAPAFRFTQSEVAEMEGILQVYHNAMPSKEIFVALADKFSESPNRKGKIQVQMKQVCNWFQNRRYAIRAKSNKSLGNLNVTAMLRDDAAPMISIPQPLAAPILPPVPVSVSASSAVSTSRKVASEVTIMDFEAKSARDGAWYDVGLFLAQRNLEMGDMEVLVRFAGFGPDEDEWLNVKKHVRQRSLPCEASECIVVIPGDLILCFQEGKDQSLYFDAQVLDAQRRRHDVRGCRCRFLVRYDHDESEEIVSIKKICRRPETDYRLRQLHGMDNSVSMDQQNTGLDFPTANAPMVILEASASQALVPVASRETETETAGASNAASIGIGNLQMN